MKRIKWKNIWLWPFALLGFIVCMLSLLGQTFFLCTLAIGYALGFRFRDAKDAINEWFGTKL